MRTAICAIIKDEHLFLKEWIEWHLGLGFDAIHLFEDKGSKSHKEITDKFGNVYLRRYEDDADVRELFVDQKTAARQQLLYSWFAVKYKFEYDYVAFIDIDEFINFSNEYDLNHLCEDCCEYPAFALSWKMMGASGHINRPIGGVVENYTISHEIIQVEKNWCFKSFVNLRKYEGMNTLHQAKGAVNIYGSENIIQPDYSKAWINHYFTKSWEDWCFRIFKRGGTQNDIRTLDLFFQCNREMEPLREKLESSVMDKNPVGCFWLDREKKIIAGGNYNFIHRFNVCGQGEYKHEEYTNLCVEIGGKRFSAVPKCGLTTLKEIVYEISCGTKHKDNSSIHSIVNSNGHFMSKLTDDGLHENVAILRDPVDRFMSMFYNKIVDERCLLFVNRGYEGVSVNMGVDGLIVWVSNELKKEIDEQDEHTRLQSTFYDPSKIDVFVWLSDLDDYLSSIGVKYDNVHKNKSSHNKLVDNEYSEFYPFIKNLYKDDYDMIERVKDKIWKNPNK